MSCPTRFSYVTSLAIALAIATPLALAETAGTAFTIQGRLAEAGAPTTGAVDLRFRLFDSETDGVALGSAIEMPSVIPKNGVFSLPLDFGEMPFLGDAVWVQIEVRPAGDPAYSLLSPRQRITPTPYALQAQRVAVNSIDEFALQTGAVTATNIATGAVGSGQIDSSQVQRRIGPDCAANQAIRAVGSDGSTSCVSLDDGDWANTPTLLATDRKVTVGSFGYRGAKLLVYSDSAINQPQLELFESQQDFARLSFTTYGDTPNVHGNFWTIAAQTYPDGDGPALDRINFFNNRTGDLFSLLGDGTASIGGSTPFAPLTVYSDGNYAPGIGNGRGDLYIGNGDAGLSLGVAMGGGGYGASRIWSKGGVDDLLLGTATDGDMVSIINGQVGIANNNPGNTLDVDGNVRVRGLTGPSGGKRNVVVDANGDLSAAVTVSARVVVPNVAFRPASSTEGWSAYAAGYSHTAGSTAPGFAELTGIPDGAEITGVTAWIEDASTARDLRVCVDAVLLTEASTDWQACIGSTADSSAGTFTPFGGPLASPQSVDYSQHSLQISLYPVLSDTTTGYSSWDGLMRLRAVRVEYRMP